MKKFFQELADFASQRSVADVALGLIVGASLGNLVQVVVEEVILPPISFFTEGINLENRALVLREAGSIDGSIPYENIAIGYGKLIEVSVEFVVIGLALFFIVKSSQVLWKRPSTVTQKKEVTSNALLERTVVLLEEQNQLLDRVVNTKSNER